MSIILTDNVRTGIRRRGRIRRAAVTGGLLDSGRDGLKARGGPAMGRSPVLVALLAVLLIGALGVGRSVTTASQNATPTATAGHP